MSDLYVSVIEPYIFQSKFQSYEIYDKYSNSFFASKYTYVYGIKLSDVREYTDQFNHDNRVSLQSQYNFKMLYITQAVYTQKFSMVNVQILSRFTVIPLL